MEHIFSYSILQAIPNPRRGERINIGLAVFLPDRIDVRIPDAELAKLRAIAGGGWSDHIEKATNYLHSVHSDSIEPSELIHRFSLLERVVVPSEVAWFSIVDVAQYEERISSILSTLVSRPKDPVIRPKQTKINTEVAREFRRSRVLASPGDTFGNHMVFRDYPVAEEEGLRADFLLKNGVYNVTATLDLRSEAPLIGQAALKAIVLDKAREVFGRKKTKRLAVYAAPATASNVRHHIELLKDYADQAFNWTVPDERTAYQRTIYDALGLTASPLFGPAANSN